MSQAGSAKRKRPEGWEAQTSASQPTPLAIVASAVAGDGIERVARSASEALGHPVAIILPSLGAPVVWPVDAIPAEQVAALVAYAVAVAGGGAAPGAPPGVGHAVPIRIGQEVVGIVAAIAGNGSASSSAPADVPAWLEAAAAAAAVTRLMPGEQTGSPRGLLESLDRGPDRPTWTR